MGAAKERAGFGRDAVAGVLLAAIGIPEQMATAQLAGLPPEAGLLAFVAAAIGFSLVGFRRILSIGADSTIAPIFAAGLTAMAASGSPQYAVLAVALAFAVGAILFVAGQFGLGWTADFFSTPVTTGFLAGIAIHIMVLQLPSALGLPPESGDIWIRVHSLVTHFKELDLRAAGFAFGVLLIAFVSEKLNPRVPGALIGLVLAIAAVAFFRPDRIALLGAIHFHIPRFALPQLSWDVGARFGALAFIVSAVVMLQTAATIRSFGRNDDSLDDVSRTFTGVGVANLFAGLAGSMPVNTSPPRTAVLTESGARSQSSSLLAAALALLLGLFGTSLLRLIPTSALAGILLYIALRIFRVSTAVEIYRETKAEFFLVIATMAAIVFLPTETGVVVGIILSLLHGMWSVSRARVVEFQRVPGTTVWWVPGEQGGAETVEGVLVLAFPAPLSFLNAYEFRRGVFHAIRRGREQPLHAVVLEANGIAEIDYTAAQILKEMLRHFAASGIDFAVARLESARAQAALVSFGLDELLRPGRKFLTVESAVQTLRGNRRLGTVK